MMKYCITAINPVSEQRSQYSNAYNYLKTKYKTAGCLDLKEIVGAKGVTASKYEVSFWRNENILKLNCGDGYTTLWI